MIVDLEIISDYVGNAERRRDRRKPCQFCILDLSGSGGGA
jgi:hypothetical protein